VSQGPYDAVMGFVLRAVTRGHRVLHRASGGRLGRRFPGGGVVVWITTKGRRSGRWRRTPLLSAPDPGDPTGRTWIVAGSNVGQVKLPDWVYNVRAHDEGQIEVDRREWACRFVEAAPDERGSLYVELVRIWRPFESYQRRAGRAIPVFRVIPR
jgi:deazaflavin-dependent oxidoreductase (nitroreductase family)